MTTTASSSAPSGAEAHDIDRAPETPPGPPCTSPGTPPGSPPRLDFAAPAAVRAWLDDLSAHVDDLAAVAEDQIAPMADRTLGRAKAEELMADARKSLADLIALARAGLASGGAP
jgi:hypothetical protein